MDQFTALIILLLWIIVPAVRVIVSPNGGAWTPPEGSNCPFGPRIGWLIIVIMLGLIGWLLFLRSRKKLQPDDVRT